MAQNQIQEQLQQLKQGQTFSHQQLLQASLVELPITQLVDRINTEMNDNPALEADASYENPEVQDYADYQGGADSNDDAEDFETRNEREERQSALDEALSGIGRDDEDMPVYHCGASVVKEREDIVYGATESFY